MPIVYDTAQVVYSALSVALSMDVLGGSMTQRRSMGGTFDPDRALFPLQLRPKLWVSDPDGIIPDGDYTNSLVECKWYIGTDGNGTRIYGTEDDYDLGSYGEITIYANVLPTSPLDLFFTCSFIDPRNQANVIVKTWRVTLSSSQSAEIALSVTLDTADKDAFSPFKTTSSIRTITAQLHNGGDDVDDSEAYYKWHVLDKDLKQYRDIDPETDLWYLSGESTKALTIDRAYVGSERLMCTAGILYLENPSLPALPPAQSKTLSNGKTYTACYGNYTARKMFKTFRFYGQYGEDVKLTRGKLIKADTTIVKAEAKVTNTRGNVTNPSKYFDIRHFMTHKYAGAAQVTVGYGDDVTVNASECSRNPQDPTVFGCEIRRLSEFRGITINGAYLLDSNGKKICAQVPDE